MSKIQWYFPLEVFPTLSLEDNVHITNLEYSGHWDRSKLLSLWQRHIICERSPQKARSVCSRLPRWNRTRRTGRKTFWPDRKRSPGRTELGGSTCSINKWSTFRSAFRRRNFRSLIRCLFLSNKSSRRGRTKFRAPRSFRYWEPNLLRRITELLFEEFKQKLTELTKQFNSAINWDFTCEFWL